jgi:hypothetical protein
MANIIKHAYDAISLLLISTLAFMVIKVKVLFSIFYLNSLTNLHKENENSVKVPGQQPGTGFTNTNP